MLHWQWDIAALAEWFVENRSALCNEELTIAGSGPFEAESLAQALDRFQNRDFAIDENEAEDGWYSALFEYRKRHSLRFALRGAAIPDIIIGCNQGTGEVSLSSKDIEWSYQFDMDHFCNNLRQALQNVLSTWLTTVQTDTVRDRAKGLLQSLEESV